MKVNDIRSLTMASAFAALIIVMTFVPQLGYITIGTVALTLIHIPVLIGAFLLRKPYALMLALIFGIGSLIRAATTPTGPLDPTFVNPFVSVLPRLLFALAAVYLVDLFKFVEKKLKNSHIYIFAIVTLITSLGIYYAGQAIIVFSGWNQTAVTLIFLVINVLFVSGYYAFIQKGDNRILVPSTFIIATFIHTVLVLSAVVIFENDLIRSIVPSGNLLSLIFSIAISNGLIEAILAAFIGTPIVVAISQLQSDR